MGNVSVFKNRKTRGILALILIAIIIVGAVCVLHGIHRRNVERDLDDLQEQVLAELERNAGTYDEQSVVLYNVSESVAKKLAEELNAELRSVQNGKYARLTLPEGTTIVDVYKNDGYRGYLEKMSADYHVKTSEITDEEGNGVHNTSAPNYTVTDGYYNLQDYINYLHVGDAWSSYRGNGVTVAVIDTGIDTDHPEFAGRISEKSYNATEDKIVKDYLLEGGAYDWSLIEDEQGHGTAVTGVIAAAMDGSGVVGIASEVTIVVIKAECDANGNFLRTSDLVFGLYYAVECGADVVNMSFGTYGNSFAAPLRLAVDSDVLCVAAAGNDATAKPCYPAADPNCISVGALEENGWALATYSNYGESIDVVAPGTTYTTKKGGDYGIMNGTSLASPIVTGAMALLKQQNKYVEYPEALELLYASSYDLGSLGRDYYFGYGALDVNALLREERGTVTFNYLTDEIEETTQVFIRNHTLQDLPEPERNFCVFDGWYYDIYCTDEVEWYGDVWTSDLTVYAKWANEDDGVPYTYVTLDDGTIEIRSYTGHRRYITIPDIIDEKIVSSIGDFAFDGQSRLRQVTLPSGLTKIGKYAFRNCNNLLNMTVPDGVTLIDEGAFYNAVRMSQIAFGNDSGLETVGDSAFAFSGVRRFDVPANVDRLNGSAFCGATDLTEIKVDHRNVNFLSLDGVLLNATKTAVVAYPAAKGTSYTIPDSVTEIGVYAFAYARFSTVDLNNVEKIGGSSFAFSSLESLTLGEKVSSLGREAFANNTALSSLTFAETIDLPTLPALVFSCCFSLEAVEIPASVTVIDMSAFANDFSLSTVTFAENPRLIGIGVGAFAATAIEEINIPASVMTIGGSAFEWCCSLERVTFGEGSLLSEIGGYAFSKTVSLSGVIFPANIAVIGDYAFLNSGLTGEVVLPAGLQSLGEGAFASCHALTAIGVEEGNEYYVSVGGVLYNKGKDLLIAYPAGKSDASYTTESTTKRIGNAAFYGSWNLTGVTLTEGSEAVGEYAFYDCANMTSYQLPASLTAIDRYAFADNANLGSISIPDNVVQISNYAFSGNKRMRNVWFGTESKLPRISFAAFANTGIQFVTIPKNVTSIAQYAFAGSSNLYSVTFAENSKLTTISAYLFDGCENLQSISFGSGSALTTIQAHGFEGMRNLRSVDFGDAKLESIGNYAFRYCERLTAVTIPDTVTVIGRYAFYGDKAIDRFDIPESVERIGRFAFYGTKNANVYFASDDLPAALQENWDEGIAGYYLGVTDVTTDGDWTYATLSSGNVAILAYTGDATELDLSALDFDGPITQIGGYAFYRSTVETVVLPDTLEKILANAFAYSNITSVTIPSNVAFIGKSAFFHATDLTSVAFAPNSRLTTLEKEAFAYTGSLASVTLPASLATMGSSAFEGSGITSVTFADGIALTEIPKGAFMGSALTSATVPAGVSLIRDNAFRDCLALDCVVFDCENVEIMSNAFYNSGLSSCSIGENVAYIGEYAFVGLQNLTAFSVSDGNAHYRAIDGVLYSKDGKKLIAMPAGRTGNFTVPATVETVGFGAFENSSLSSVSFEDGINLLTVGYRAFYNAGLLTEITIPESVVSIDYYAFAMCKNLTTVTFAGDNLRGVYEGAFYGDRKLKNIVLSDAIVEISDYAFYGCASLARLPISGANELKGIYDYAFAYSGITELTLPESVIDIGAYAFMGTKLKSVVIPKTNQRELVIGIGAFQECENLEVLDIPFIGSCYEDEDYGWFGYVFGAGGVAANETYIPHSLKKVSIGVSAPGSWGYIFGNKDFFANNKDFFANVEEIVLPTGITNVGGSAFYGCSSLTSIEIPAGVTSIGSSAFYGCSSLTCIEIPAGVTSIEGFAFSGCSSLTSIEIPAGVTSIGYETFSGCSSLTSIEIPAGVTSIEYGTFWGCSSLTSIKIPAGVTRIGSSTFYGCSSLTSIEIPAGVTSIEYGTFWECSGLTSIKIPAGVTSIGNYAFYNCSSLTSIEIPAGVTSIEYGAFYYCSSLTSIEIPAGVISIGEYAFYECRSLTSIEIPDSVTNIGSSAFSGCSNLKSIEIPVGITEIGNNMFYNCSTLTSIEIPAGVTSVGQNAFVGCYQLRSVHYLGDITGWCEIAFSGRFFSAYSLYFNDSLVTELVIPAGVTSIEYGAFSGCSSLTSIEIPDSVTNIGSYAFSGCSSLTSIKIPAGVTSIEPGTFRGSGLSCVLFAENSRLERIGTYAFEVCGDLTSIEIPSGVTSIGQDAFMGCVRLYQIVNHSNLPLTIGSTDNGYVASSAKVIVDRDGNRTYREEGNDFICLDTPDGFRFIVENGRYQLIAYFGAENTVTLPSNINGNTYEIFEMRGVKNVILPNDFTRIGYSAFSGCSTLTSIEIPDSVTNIGSYAFKGCSGLTSIKIPASVTSIEYGAFLGCSGLTNFAIDSDNENFVAVDGVVYNKEMTHIIFVLDSVTNIVIPATVTAFSFAGNTTLQTVSFESGSQLSVIDSQAFMGCSSLTSIEIPAGVTGIGIGAFYGCNSLMNIEIPDCVTRIGSSTFYGCSSLTSIEIPAGVTSIEYGTFWGCSSLTSIKIPACVTSIGNYAFYNCSSLTSIEIPAGVISIEGSAFFGCSSLTSIEIPAGVTSIGHHTFYDCSSLTSIEIPDGITNIGYDAFSGCSSLTSIKIPVGVTSIEYGTFQRCSSLMSIEIPAGVTTIGDSAFSECSSLMSIKIPAGVTSIGNYAFSNCSSLTSIKIPAAITAIGNGTFYYCSSLTSIEIPAGVTSIGEYAFAGCSSLTSIEIPAGVTSIGDSAFSGCSSLMNIEIPDCVTSIEYGTFWGCSSLTSIKIPAGVTSIEYGTFWGCSSLTSIEIPADVTIIGDSAFYGCSSLASITIPAGVMGIGDDTFRRCSSLTSIEIPAGVTIIGDSAFWGCSSLTSIEIPDSVTAIGGAAFSGCSSLTSIEIPAGVTSIGNEAFRGCSSLTSIEIPAGVTSIGEYAFAECDGLVGVVFPVGVASIGRGAFLGCFSLTSVEISAGVTNIGEAAFAACIALYRVVNHSDLNLQIGSEENGNIAYYAKVVVDKNGNPTFRTDEIGVEYTMTADGFLFALANERYQLIAYLGVEDTVIFPTEINGNPYEIYRMRGVKNAILPDGITKIGYDAFSECRSLMSVLIPASVIDIGMNAFHNCRALTRVTFAENSRLDSIGFNAFANCSRLESIEIPDSVTRIYSYTLNGTALYDDSSNWQSGALYVGKHLIAVDPDVVAFTVRTDTIAIADDAFNGCFRLKTVELGGNHAFVLSSTTNLETLILDEMITNYHEYGAYNSDYPPVLDYFGSIPITLKNIVLKKGCRIYTDYSFNGITGITIYVEDDKRDVQWDHDYPGWNNGNRVYYGGKWIEATFLSADGEILSDAFYTSSQIIRQPHVADNFDGAVAEIFAGWDLDGDGVADFVPATGARSFTAVAVTAKTVAEYHVNFYGFDNQLFASETYGYGDVITLPAAPTKAGYTFHGWSGYTAGMTVDGNLDLYAVWEHDNGRHRYEKTTVPPTCTEAGYDAYVCADCGDEYRENYVDAQGHAFGDWTEETAPTCTADGTEKRVCSRCGETEYRTVECPGHDYQATVTREATCQRGGEIRYVCSVCGNVAVTETPKTDHNYEKVITDGLFIRTLIAASNDLYYGYENNNVVFYRCPGCNHIMTKGDNTSLSVAAMSAENELTDWQTFVAPTCREDGILVRYSVESGKIADAKTIDAQKHDLIHHDAKAATCTAIGWNAYDTCSRCDYTTYVELSVLGHDYQATVTPPTQTERGYTTRVCSRCGDSYVDSYVDALEVGESRDLLQELTATLDRITTVDLNSYQTLKDVYDRSASLLDADRATLNAKLAPMMEEYTRLAQQINAEYSAAGEIENTYFVVILGAVQALTALAFVSMKGKRWF